MEEWLDHFVAFDVPSSLIDGFFLGTPVELSPDNDNPAIASDDSKINNFTFDHGAGQRKCPFASHMRKSNPRNDVSPVESAFRHLYGHYLLQDKVGN